MITISPYRTGRSSPVILSVTRCSRRSLWILGLWKALCAAGEEDGRKGELGEKCRRFQELVETYRGYTVYMPIRQLLETIAPHPHNPFPAQNPYP